MRQLDQGSKIRVISLRAEWQLRIRKHSLPFVSGRLVGEHPNCLQGDFVL